jgi:hypothetical protein
MRHGRHVNALAQFSTVIYTNTCRSFQAYHSDQKRRVEPLISIEETKHVDFSFSSLDVIRKVFFIG